MVERAQALAALATATSPQLLGMFHLLSTAAFDAFFWAALTFLVLRTLRTDDERLWVPIGALAGVALLNKWNAAFVAAGLVAGLLLGGRRRVLTTRAFWAGAALALVIWLPNLVWNAHHDWAELSMTQSLHDENSGFGASLQFIPGPEALRLTPSAHKAHAARSARSSSRAWRPAMTPT